MRKILELERDCDIELAELKKEHEITQKEIVRFQKEVDKAEKSKQQLIKILDYETWLSNNFLNLINFTEKNILAALRKEFTKIFTASL